MNTKHYTYRVTWSPEDGEHVGLCAELPSLSWLAKTPEAALKLKFFPNETEIPQ